MAAEVWGWERFFAEVNAFLSHLEINNSHQYLQHCLERLETKISSVALIRRSFADALSRSGLTAQQISIVHHYKELLDELIMNLNEVLTEVNNCLDSSGISYHSSTVHNGRRGRPRFEVTADQLEYLVSLSFSWTCIARMLGISRMTLYRRRVQFGMLQRGRTIGYNELLVLLQQIRKEFPSIGEVMVLGKLRALGYHVLRDQLRRGIRETDPINTALRAITGPISRRVYSVPGPNSLWHMGMFMRTGMSRVQTPFLIGECVSWGYSPGGWTKGDRVILSSI